VTFDDLLVYGMIALGLAPIVLIQWWMERRRRDTDQYLKADAAARREAEEAEARGEPVAIVLPLGWNLRDDAGTRYGLQVQNYGPEIAQNVRIVGRTNDGAVLTSLRVLRPSEGIVALSDYTDGEVPKEIDEELPRIRPHRNAWMRVLWDNPDGSPGDSDWVRVQRWI
jgi:hypothetical protein